MRTVSGLRAHTAGELLAQPFPPQEAILDLVQGGFLHRGGAFALPTKDTLLAADMAGLNHRPVSDEARKLVDHLTTITLEAEEIKEARERARSPQAMRGLKDTIGALLYDLLDASRNVEALGFCFRQESTTSFTETVAACRPYRAVREQWKALDLLDHARINKGTVEMNGASFSIPYMGLIYAPRLRATAKLLGIAGDHGITADNLDDHFKPAALRDSPVLLNRKPIGRQMPETDLIECKVCDLNAHLVMQAFTPSMTPQLVVMFQDDPTAPGEPVRGGRLYSRGRGSFQQLPKAERLTMTINGEPVVEIDVKASHLSIYLAHQGVQLEAGRDLYEVPGVPREIVKHLVNAVFGKGHTGLTRWPGLEKDAPKNDALRQARLGRKVGDDLATILEAIPELRKLPREKGPNSLMVSGTLQKIEAAVILETLMTLKDEHGVTTLPVHDSVIVPASKADIGADVLRQHFKAATGSYPILVIREAGKDDRLAA